MKIKSEELLSRFRSKEDLYKYLTQYVGLFLPSYKATKLSFIRAILSNQKKALKSSEITLTSVPKFEELSVKNLYVDAMKDNILKDYLPDMEMNSNRLPEREFFFGILSTLRNQYLKQIINDANVQRYQTTEEQGREDYISIQENWYNELIKHPFISRKPGKAIFLIKQRSKLIRNKKMYHKFDVSQRLNQSNEEEKQYLEQYEKSSKRQKVLNQKDNDMNASEEDGMTIMQFNI